MNQEKCTTNKKKFQHLNKEERKIIERLLGEGVRKIEIARILRRDVSTIKREIKRGMVEQRKRNPNHSKKIEAPEYIEFEKYYAETGQIRYEANRLKSGAKSKIVKCRELTAYIEERILSEERWSPDAAIGYAKKKKKFANMICTKTAYNWINNGLMKVKNIDLLLKVKRKPNSKHKEHKKVLGRSIEERPVHIDAREEFGHWEGDGIVGAKHKGHLITLVERKTGVGLLFNVKDKKDIRIVDVLAKIKKEYGQYYNEIFKTITFDNGSEFTRSYLMEKDSKTMVYYAHPYSSWERGINENWNGIVRRFIPKGSSFEKFDDTDITRVNHYINSMPRKRLDYQTPLEMWDNEILLITA